MRDSLVSFLKQNGRPVLVALLTIDLARDEDQQWTATCLELGTVACAESLEQARDEIKEAVELQLNGMAQLGYTTEYLRETGVHFFPVPTKRRPSPIITIDPAKSRWEMASATL